VCEEGFSLFVDVTWRHIGQGERFGVGLRGTKGTAAVNPLKVWKELHGTPTDVAPTSSVSRENAFTASFRAQWAHFQAAVAGNVPTPSLAEQVTLHKLLDAIYRSAQDGREAAL
jgi:predicted dehydrogenase